MIDSAMNTNTADTTIGIHSAESPTMTTSRNGGLMERTPRVLLLIALQQNFGVAESTLSLTTTPPRKPHEASHRHWRHLLQSQRRCGTTGLVQAASRNRRPGLGWHGLHLDRR